MRDPRQGFIGWFIRQVVENKEITIYEPGTRSAIIIM